jgi:hypothetical protein
MFSFEKQKNGTPCHQLKYQKWRHDTEQNGIQHELAKMQYYGEHFYFSVMPSDAFLLFY